MPSAPWRSSISSSISRCLQLSREKVSWFPSKGEERFLQELSPHPSRPAHTGTVLWRRSCAGWTGPCSLGSGSHDGRRSHPGSDPGVLPSPPGSRLGPPCREDKPSPVTSLSLPLCPQNRPGRLVLGELLPSRPDFHTCHAFPVNESFPCLVRTSPNRDPAGHTSDSDCKGSRGPPGGRGRLALQGAHPVQGSLGSEGSAHGRRGRLGGPSWPPRG